MVVEPFTKTREKIISVNDEQEECMLRQFYTDNQATPWMLPKGGKNRELNVEEYLNQIHFDQAFD
jgi:hypothetical protein